jgi:hypothetical protein
MAKFVDKTRSTYCGMKGVVNTQAWGADKATERYGSAGVKVHSEPAKGLGPYHPQDPTDKPVDPNYNDASGWVRAQGSNAENRPGYAPGYRAPRGDKTGSRPSIRRGDVGPHK